MVLQEFKGSRTYVLVKDRESTFVPNLAGWSQREAVSDGD